jgi:hypothetical protein
LPHPLNYGNWIDNALYQEPGVQKVLLWEKLVNISALEADVVVVGDSSALHGFAPESFDASAEGLRSVNLSCCSDIGFDGYLNTARIALTNNKNASALVMNISPRARHAKDSQLSHEIEKEFLSIRRFLTPPSVAWKQQITNLLYYGDNSSEFFTRRDSTINKRFNSFEELAKVIRDSHGWLPFRDEDREPMELHRCGFDPSNTLSLIQGIGHTVALAREFNVTPVILFSPVMCRMNKHDLIEAQLVSRALADIAEVIVPVPFGEFWKMKYFNDRFHLNREGAMRFSANAGEALKMLRKENIH